MTRSADTFRDIARLVRNADRLGRNLAEDDLANLRRRIDCADLADHERNMANAAWDGLCAKWAEALIALRTANRAA